MIFSQAFGLILGLNLCVIMLFLFNSDFEGGFFSYNCLILFICNLLLLMQGVEREPFKKKKPQNLLIKLYC